VIITRNILTGQTAGSLQSAAFNIGTEDNNRQPADLERGAGNKGKPMTVTKLGAILNAAFHYLWRSVDILWTLGRMANDREFREEMVEEDQAMAREDREGRLDRYAGR